MFDDVLVGMEDQSLFVVVYEKEEAQVQKKEKSNDFNHDVTLGLMYFLSLFFYLKVYFGSFRVFFICKWQFSTIICRLPDAPCNDVLRL